MTAVCAPLRLSALGKAAILAAWDGGADGAVRGLRAAIDGRLLPPPVAHVAIDAGEGRRHLMALRVGLAELADRTLEIRDSAGATVATDAADVAQRLADSEFDAAALLAGEGEARVRVARFLLDLCPSLLRLGGDPEFLVHARAVVAELSRHPAPLAPRCALGEGRVLAEALVARGLGERLGAVLLDASGLRRAPAAPQPVADARPRAGLRRVALLLDRAAFESGARVILLGEGGVAVRRIAPAGTLDSADAWAGRARPEDAGTLRYAMDCLAAAGQDDPGAAALLSELRFAIPAPVPPAGGPIEARVDVVVGTLAGAFVAGRLRDPHGLAAALEVERHGRFATAPVATLARFAPPGADAAADGADGFAAFLPALGGGLAAAPCRVALRLASGARLALAEAVTAIAPAAQREAVLASIPPGFLDRRLAETLLGPPVQASFAAPAPPAAVERLDFGAPAAEPAVSLIVPVGDAPDLIRCRFALLATDPARAGIELIHVLDRPARRAAAAALLADLARAYGLATRLVVAGDEPAEALEAAVGGSRAALLAFLAADVVPEAPGWLDRLAAALARRTGAGLAVARVLNEDESIVDAGIEIADADGAPRLRPRLAGFPRDFAAAAGAARVPFARLDAALLPREVHARAGGFGCDWLTRDAREADFSARVRAACGEVWQFPDVVALRLGVPAAAPASRGLDPRAELDRRQFVARWRQLFAVEDVQAPAAPAAPARGRRATRRARARAA